MPSFRFVAASGASISVTRALGDKRPFHELVKGATRGAGDLSIRVDGEEYTLALTGGLIQWKNGQNPQHEVERRDCEKGFHRRTFEGAPTDNELARTGAKTLASRKEF